MIIKCLIFVQNRGPDSISHTCHMVLHKHVQDSLTLWECIQPFHHVHLLTVGTFDIISELFAELSSN